MIEIDTQTDIFNMHLDALKTILVRVNEEYKVNTLKALDLLLSGYVADLTVAKMNAMNTASSAFKDSQDFRGEAFCRIEQYGQDMQAVAKVFTSLFERLEELAEEAHSDIYKLHTKKEAKKCTT